MSQPYRSASVDDVKQRLSVQRDEALSRLRRCTPLFRAWIRQDLRERLDDLEGRVSRLNFDSHESLPEAEGLVEQFAEVVETVMGEELPVAVELSRKTPGFPWPDGYGPPRDANPPYDPRAANALQSLVNTLGKSEVKAARTCTKALADASGRTMLGLACAFVTSDDASVVAEARFTFNDRWPTMEQAFLHTYVAQGFPKTSLAPSGAFEWLLRPFATVFGAKEAKFGDHEFDERFRVTIDPRYAERVFPAAVRARFVSLYSAGTVLMRVEDAALSLMFESPSREAFAKAIRVVEHMRKIDWQWLLITD